MTGQQNNPAINRHLKLEIKRLQNAPRGDADRLNGLLKAKEKENQQATHIEYTESWLQTFKCSRLTIISGSPSMDGFVIRGPFFLFRRMCSGSTSSSHIITIWLFGWLILLYDY
jgi:hypothetical protein